MVSVGRCFWDPGYESGEKDRDFPLSQVPVCIFPLDPLFLPDVRLLPLVPTPHPQLRRNWPAPPSQPLGAPPLLVGQKLTSAPAVVYLQSAPVLPANQRHHRRGPLSAKSSTSEARRSRANASPGREGMSVSEEN